MNRTPDNRENRIKSPLTWNEAASNMQKAASRRKRFGDVLFSDREIEHLSFVKWRFRDTINSRNPHESQ